MHAGGHSTTPSALANMATLYRDSVLPARYWYSHCLSSDGSLTVDGGSCFWARRHWMTIWALQYQQALLSGACRISLTPFTTYTKTSSLCRRAGPLKLV